MEKTIRLELTVDDVNTVLAALGVRPFAQVYALIGRIQQQAAEQLEDDDGGSIELPVDDD